MLKNNHGYLPLQALLVIATIATITVRGTVDSYSSGNLKKGGQTIICKMQGQGQSYCDQKYGFVAHDAVNSAE